MTPEQLAEIEAQRRGVRKAHFELTPDDRLNPHVDRFAKWMEVAPGHIDDLCQALREAWAEIELFKRVLADNEVFLEAICAARDSGKANEEPLPHN